MKIYTVVHNEIFADVEETYKIDAVVSHTAGTKDGALEYIRTSHANSYSWWEVFESGLDSEADPESVGLYGPRGRLRKGPPLTRHLVKLFRRAKGQGPQVLN